VVLALSAAPAADAVRGLTTGFGGDPSLTDGSGLAAHRWIPDAVDEGAQVVRFNVLWSAVAPARRPKGFDASDPNSRGYNWTGVDAGVRQLAAQGRTVLFTISMAPRWAEGPHPGRFAQAGTWEPSTAAFGAFAKAAATRYDGHFPDPLHRGAFLPRVDHWQGWNEPNLAYYLDPQWRRVGSQWVPASPEMFRGLMNAFYRAVKSVSASNFVVMGGTAPYGDAPGGARMPPVQFDRYLFCMTGGGPLKPLGCSDPVHFDAIAHHPYGVGGPLMPALNPDDVAVPDLGKLTRVMHAAQRYGLVQPSGPKQFWVTEISWDSDPPDPQGVPLQRQARWYEQAMYVLWLQGVSTVLWLQIVDSPPIPNYASSYQAGLYFLDGRPKPAATAVRFPFVTRRLGGDAVQAWGRAPQAGTVSVEERVDGSWRVVAHLSAGAHQVFVRTLHIAGAAVLRAQVGSQTSLTWNQSS